MKIQKKKKSRIQKNLKCQVCRDSLVPDYKDLFLLARFMTRRGKILSREKTGTCRKHQRLLMLSIKRARIMSLIAFEIR